MIEGFYFTQRRKGKNAKAQITSAPSVLTLASLRETSAKVVNL